MECFQKHRQKRTSEDFLESLELLKNAPFSGYFILFDDFLNLISESKYRALMMIEKDDFNRQLIHSYGARGVALVRLLEEKDDTDEVCYEGPYGRLGP